MQNKDYLSQTFHLDYLFCLIYSCMSFIPYCTNHYFMTIFVFSALTFITIFIRIILNGKTDGREGGIYFAIIIWLLLIIGSRIIGISTAEWGNYAKRFMYFSPIFCFTFYMSKKEYKFISIVFTSLLIISVGNAVYNLYMESQYSGLLQNSKPYLFRNYSFIDTIGTTNMFFVFLSFFVAILNSRDYLSRKRRAFSHLILALFAILIYLSGRTTSFIALIVFLYISLLLVKENLPQNRVLFYGILTGIVILLVYFNLGSIARIIPNERISVRLQAIAGDDQGNYLLRLQLIGNSISTWTSSIKTFLFGAGLNLSGDFITDIAGQHSSLFDGLAYYGLFGVVFVGFIFISYYKFCKSIVTHIVTYKAIRYWFLFVCFSIVFSSYMNPDSSIALFVIIPSAAVLIDQRIADDTYQTVANE